MSKETFPSMSLIDPHSISDIRGRMISIDANNGSIWYMLVTFAGGMPEFLVSVGISQLGKEGQSLSLRYCQIRGNTDPVLYKYNEEMLAIAGKSEEYVYNKGTEYDTVYITDGKEELGLALDFYTNGNGVVFDKLLSEIPGAPYIDMWSLYSSCFDTSEGELAIKSMEAFTDYYIIIGRYTPAMLSNFIQVTPDNVRDFANYRPVLYEYILNNLGKDAKDINKKANRERKAEIIGGVAGLATGLLAAASGGLLLQGRNRELIGDVNSGFKSLFIPIDANPKKGDILSKSVMGDKPKNDIKVSQITNI